jgi:hypothetical protein
MKKTLLAFALTVVAATASAQNVDSTTLPQNAGIPFKIVKLFRVLAGTGVTVYSFKQCFNQYVPPEGAGGYWYLNNPTLTDMYFVCEGW